MIELTHIRRDNDLLRAVFQAEKDARAQIRARESAALKNLINHVGEVSCLPVSYEKLDKHLQAMRGVA
jgi:hypothetical protein